MVQDWLLKCLCLYCRNDQSPMIFPCRKIIKTEVYRHGMRAVQDRVLCPIYTFISISVYSASNFLTWIFLHNGSSEISDWNISFQNPIFRFHFFQRTCYWLIVLPYLKIENKFSIDPGVNRTYLDFLDFGVYLYFSL